MQNSVDKKVNNRLKPFSATFLVVAILLLGIFTLNFASAFDWSEANYIQAYYKLDGTSGVVVDALGINNGTNYGATRGATGKILTAFDFEASDPDYVNITKLNQSDLTISVWVKPESIIAYGGIVVKDGETKSWSLDMGSTGQTRIRTKSVGGAVASVSGTSNMVAGNWYHIVATYNSTNGATRLWKNGVNEINDTTGVGVLEDSPTRNISFGKFLAGATPYYFDGIMDEVGIWNYTLSDSEIAELYNSGSGLAYDTVSMEPSIVLEYPSNDSVLNSIGANFTVVGTNISDGGYVWRNITYKIWNATDLFNSTFVDFADIDAFNETLYIDDFTIGNHEWNAEACYGDGVTENCTSSGSNSTYFVGITINGFDWTNSTFSSEINNFSIGIDYNPLLLSASGINIILNYNGTNYTTSDYGTSPNITFWTDTSAPEVISTTNVPFYYIIELYSGDSEVQLITETYNQSVQTLTEMEITSTTCSVGLTMVMNYTFSDEGNLTSLNNMNIDYNFKYGISNSTGLAEYGSLSGVTQLLVCLNTTQSDYYTLGYGEIEYEREGYTSRRYYVFDSTRVSNVTINTTLYSLVDSDSTSFLIEIREPTLTAYSDVYTTLLRWYPDLNEYKVVEMGRTDEKGQTVKKVKVEDVDYRIGVYEQNGSLIYLANPIRMVCLASPCSYTLTIRERTSSAFDEAGEVEGELTYDSGLFRFIYNDPSQNTDLMNLVVYKLTGTSKNVICSSNSTSFSGVLTCDVSAYDGLLEAIVFRTASPERPSFSLIIDTTETIFQGTFGLFLQFMIIVTTAFLGIISPVVAIIMGLVGLLFGVLVFKTVTYPIFIGVAVAGGIVIHFMMKGGGK